MNTKYLYFTGGNGSVETQWVLAQVVAIFMKEAKQENMDPQVIDRKTGEVPNSLLSALIQIKPKEDKFLKKWIGTLQWVGKSKFRKNHKRKNWFVGCFEIASDHFPTELNEKDLQFSTMRASGPGGQHVNKVETAVMVKHLPTGLSAQSQAHRSQVQNKKAAIEKIKKRIKVQAIEQMKNRNKQPWETQFQLERGNPVRVFKGTDFKSVYQEKKYRKERTSEKQKWKQKIKNE